MKQIYLTRCHKLTVPVSQRKGKPLLRRRQWALREIEAIGHRARTAVALVQGGQVESLLAEAHQADMRVQFVRDVPSFRIGAQHQARNARTVAERVTIE